MSTQIDRLIISSPYEEPARHWFYERERRDFRIKSGRRLAGYVRATPDAQGFDDPGIFVEIPLVNQIRGRVKRWREGGYAGVTGITRRLLEHWHDLDEDQEKRFFFCQLEAIETLIWLTEAPARDRAGIDIGGDGGEFERWCNKMATGSGKTIVMAMIIAWNFLNKIAYPADARFSRNVFIVAPGLTIKSRLQVLQPSNEQNYYEEFNIVPAALMDKLRQGRVLIHNWHALTWDTEDKIKRKIEKKQLRSVDKRGHIEISVEAYTHKVLGDMATAGDIIVINDEAHHAWRKGLQASGKTRRDDTDSIEEATIWVGGLDRIHKQVGILRCFDLSATPFSPNSEQEEALFPWIVSDFGLNDAIESGLVKTPRVPTRDDAMVTADMRSRIYHIFMNPEVKDDLTREADESERLPDLVLNAYNLLGSSWQETQDSWPPENPPPVMITVANRIETSSRIKYAFTHQHVRVLALCQPEYMLQIDSKALRSAEIADTTQEITAGAKPARLTQQQRAEQLRLTVDTIGQKGKPGEQIRNVISVGMLSEGWDAKTVTHIMGLRAFSSQLLCEQVVGRGLRRVSYELNAEGQLDPEYVNVFGVPFSFLPCEATENNPPPLPPKTRIEPVAEKQQYALSWPNVVRIDREYRYALKLDWSRLTSIPLDRYNITEAEMGDVIAGRPHPGLRTILDMERLAKEVRMQTFAFEIAAEIYNSKQSQWHGSEVLFIAQLVGFVEQFLRSDKLTDTISLGDEKKRRVFIILNMRKIINHLWSFISVQNTKVLTPVFSTEQPVRSTADARPWFTKKPCEWTHKSHINLCVYDSGWEATEAFKLDRSEKVQAFVKNDHIGFFVLYTHKGVVRKYYPDFIIRLSNGKHLILEVKGQDDEQSHTKRLSLDEWVQAVNAHGGFGEWRHAVSRHPSDVDGICNAH